jgi:hypothetical protein
MKPAIRQMGREQDRVQNIISCLHIRCNANETRNLHVYRCTLRINVLLIFTFLQATAQGCCGSGDLPSPLPGCQFLFVSQVGGAASSDISSVMCECQKYGK